MPGAPEIPRPASVCDKCWQRQLVGAMGLFPQPWFVAVDGDRVGPADLGDVLLARPGSYILKPRFGSNGAVVARDFREVSLEEALAVFLTPRVPPADLEDAVRCTCDSVLAAGELAVAAVAPLARENGVRVHQLGIDGRLCWNSATSRAEFWFLEFQFGIGRIDGPPPPGYQSPAELRERFGPESG